MNRFLFGVSLLMLACGGGGTGGGTGGGAVAGAAGAGNQGGWGAFGASSGTGGGGIAGAAGTGSASGGLGGISGSSGASGAAGSGGDSGSGGTGATGGTPNLGPASWIYYRTNGNTGYIVDVAAPTPVPISVPGPLLWTNVIAGYLSDNGQRFAVVANDKQGLEVWDTSGATASLEYKLVETEEIFMRAPYKGNNGPWLTPTRILYTVGQAPGQFRVLDVSSKTVTKLGGGTSHYGYQASEDGSWVAWYTGTLYATRADLPGTVADLGNATEQYAWDPTSLRLAVQKTGSGPHLVVYNFQTGAPVIEWSGPQSAESFSWSSKGSRLAFTQANPNAGVYLVDFAKPAPAPVLLVSAKGFNPNMRVEWMRSGNLLGAQVPSTSSLWDASVPKDVTPNIVSTSLIWKSYSVGLSATPDDRWLWWESSSGLQLTDRNSPSEKTIALNGHSANFLPDTNLLIVGGAQHSKEMFDMSSGTPQSLAKFTANNNGKVRKNGNVAHLIYLDPQTTKLFSRAVVDGKLLPARQIGSHSVGNGFSCTPCTGF